MVGLQNFIQDGGAQADIVTVVNAATYTIQVGDCVVQVDYSATGTVTLTLPSAADAYDAALTTATSFRIVDTGCNSGTNAITIQRAGSDTIIGGQTGLTSVTLSRDGAAIDIQAVNATTWMAYLGGYEVTIDNDAANRLVTANGDGTFNAEDGIEFDADILSFINDDPAIRGRVYSGTNQPAAATAIYIRPPQPTGNATSCSVIIQSTSAGGSGSALQTLVDTLTITDEKVGIGTASPALDVHISDGNIPDASTFSSQDRLMISGQGFAPGFNILAASSIQASHRGVFKATRTRGTLSSPTAAVNNDNVMSFLGVIYDGTNDIGTAAVDFFVDGTVSTNVAPQRISFVTSATNAAGRTERLVVKSTGLVGINETSPDDQLHVKVSASGQVECLKLEQLDVSEGFCNYVSTVAGTTVNPLTTITHAPRAGFKRIEVNGGDQWEPFYGTPVAATAYTQTYSAASVTHAARTAAALTDSTGGTANTTVAAVSGSGDDATINDNFADIIAMLENLRQDQINTAQVLNQVIDDQQVIGNAA